MILRNIGGGCHPKTLLQDLQRITMILRNIGGGCHQKHYYKIYNELHDLTEYWWRMSPKKLFQDLQRFFILDFFTRIFDTSFDIKKGLPQLLHIRRSLVLDIFYIFSWIFSSTIL